MSFRLLHTSKMLVRILIIFLIPNSRTMDCHLNGATINILHFWYACFLDSVPMYRMIVVCSNWEGTHGSFFSAFMCLPWIGTIMHQRKDILVLCSEYLVISITTWNDRSSVIIAPFITREILVFIPIVMSYNLMLWRSCHQTWYI